ncbi:MAG TPA: response regulator [Phycisphaerae bacterium]|nr:response regulator [Phycisphaerae bacterium]HUT57671.1 response regulator [Phycisphaerae bacterium]
MVATLNRKSEPFGLVVSGEAGIWQRALERIVGPQLLVTYEVRGDTELLEVVQSGVADAAVLDDDVDWRLDVLQLLRMIRRVNEHLPVVVVTRRTDRRVLESALRLAAFSVVHKPLELEELLRQIQRIMIRLDEMLRADPDF